LFGFGGLPNTCPLIHFAQQTSTVILGATKPEQVIENLKALDVLNRLTPEVYGKINLILANEPVQEVRFVYADKFWV
jgi:hypothetical protein